MGMLGTISILYPNVWVPRVCMTIQNTKYRVYPTRTTLGTFDAKERTHLKSMAVLADTTDTNSCNGCTLSPSPDEEPPSASLFVAERLREKKGTAIFPARAPRHNSVP